MMENPMNQILMDGLGKALETVYRSGEWDDRFEALLEQWRTARGEDGKSPWRWWARIEGDETYANELPSRDDAIHWAREEYGPRETIEIIEARCWTDEVKGDENCWFAETRGYEKLGPVEAVI